MSKLQRKIPGFIRTPTVAICVGLLVMCVGVYLIARSSAASVAASSETETGAISGAASRQGDIGASSGQSVRFNMPSPSSKTPRGMWVWDPKDATDIKRRDNLIDFAVRKGVNRLYIESEDLVVRDQAALTSLCAAAAKYNIRVELLFGNSQWAYAAQHAHAVSLATKAAQYVASLKGPKPTAVHFDVEPHTLPDFETNKDEVFGQYLLLLQKLQAAKGPQLQLSVDYPLGFDILQANVGGTTKLMSDWIYSYIDRGIMMDYRDFADTEDGLIARVAYSMQRAASASKTVGIGVETLCGLEPEKVSFCEEGEAVMLQELAKTQAAYKDSAAFGGFSIHYYGSYVSLKP